jgi:FAD/FMN-containing dehydrogenase
MTTTPAALVDSLRSIVGAPYVLSDASDTASFNHEWRGLYEGKSFAVARPETTQQVSEIVKLCAQTQTPIVPQGGNTGLVGGQVSADSRSLIVSLSRMNKIRSLVGEGFSMVAEAGVTVQAAQEAAEKVNRLFALSLGSEGSCQIGGTVSTNAGGMNALLYGMMRSQVFGLEVVLAGGQIWNGLKLLRKDNSGYDLKQLFIGAEGTLGIVTAASMKLFPLPEVVETAFIAVPNMEAALALTGLLQDRFPQQLSRCELIPELGLQMVIAHIAGARRPLKTVSPWYVVIELVAGKGAELREPLNQCLAAGLEQGIITDATIADSGQQRKDFWHLRETLPEAQREEGGSIKLDISLPLKCVPDFFKRAEAIIERLCSGARPVPFGHLGDGNIHYDICQPPGMDKQAFLNRWDEIADPLHAIVLEDGGSIAAEHGIGVLKVKKIAKTKAPLEIELMKKIKAALDPQNIMNPGKIIDS